MAEEELEDTAVLRNEFSRACGHGKSVVGWKSSKNNEYETVQSKKNYVDVFFLIPTSNICEPFFF